MTAPGKFPKGATTLRAAVLATMLAGDAAGAYGLFAHGSTKVATVMRALTRRYRWPIERREFATNTPDGLVAWVSMYTLPQSVIAAAFEQGAGDWIAEVHAARNRRRASKNILPAPAAKDSHCLVAGAGDLADLPVPE